MQVKDLIDKLKEMPQDANIVVFDHRKNLCRTGGDASGEGVHEFEVELVKYEGDEKDYIEEQTLKEFIPFVTIVFDNDDYNDDGKCILEQSN